LASMIEATRLADIKDPRLLVDGLTQLNNHVNASLAQGHLDHAIEVCDDIMYPVTKNLTVCANRTYAYLYELMEPARVSLDQKKYGKLFGGEVPDEVHRVVRTALNIESWGNARPELNRLFTEDTPAINSLGLNMLLHLYDQRLVETEFAEGIVKVKMDVINLMKRLGVKPSIQKID